MSWKKKMAREKSCIKTLGTKTQTSFDFIWFVKKKKQQTYSQFPQAKGKSTCIHTLCIAFVFNYLSTISTYLPPEYQYLPSYSTNPTSQIPPSQLPTYAVYMPFQILKTSHCPPQTTLFLPVIKNIIIGPNIILEIF